VYFPFLSLLVKKPKSLHIKGLSPYMVQWPFPPVLGALLKKTQVLLLVRDNIDNTPSALPFAHNQADKGSISHTVVSISMLLQQNPHPSGQRMPVILTKSATRISISAKSLTISCMLRLQLSGNF
jgi:hypothetical protein